MSPTTPPAQVTPRRAGDPEPDLTGIRLAHRSMVADCGRIVDLVTAIADGRERCTPTRARAVSRYVELLCESIHHHHTTEDEVAWPVIEASAGRHVDLTELTEDHAALDPRLDQLRARAAAFRVSGGDTTTAAAMAAELTDLHTLVSEHVAEEEREVFPVIAAHVSMADWAAVEKAAQKSSRMSFDAPRNLAVLTEDERARLGAELNPLLRMLFALLSIRHRRLERAVFG
jgi:iron-sulfur cluster repair protein YtfE (RIC family)